MTMFIDDETYANILHNVVIPTVDLIIINKQGNVLLGLRNNDPLKGVYYIPWGRIHKWETMVQAAKRKAKEELGLDINADKLQSVWTYDDIFSNSAFDWVSTHCIPSTFIYQLNWDEEQQLKVADIQHKDIQFFNSNDPTLHPFLQKRLQTIDSIYHIFP